jgi:hypothetical protein
VRNTAGTQWHFCNFRLKCHGFAPKRANFGHESSYAVRGRDAAEASVFIRCAAAIVVGNPMKSVIAAHLPDEHFVIRVDGRVKSHHRRFLDALREGLQLRDQFPQHDVKVQSMQPDGQQRAAAH